MDYTRWGMALVLIAMLVFLMALLRWTFSRGKSLVNPAQAPGSDFVPVRIVPTFIEAEVLRCTLQDSGVEARTGEHGSRATVLVRELEIDKAERILTSRR